MPDPYPQLAALGVLAMIAALVISAQLVSIARDSDWWVITRGVLRGRYERHLRPRGR